MSELSYIVAAFNNNISEFCLLSASLNWVSKLYRNANFQDQTVKAFLFVISNQKSK